MDPKRLKTFIAVANHGSFTDAAKELFIAQSAVSKHINQLEESLGVQLFLRDNRMVRLTAAGESLYRDATEILDRIDAAVSRLQGLSAPSQRHLSVGVFSLLASEVVDLLRAFRSSFPDIPVSLDWYEFRDLIARLEDGTLDVIFIPEFAVASKPQICRAPAFPGPMHVVVGKNSPLAQRKSLSLSDLAGYTYYTMRPDVTPDGYVSIQNFFAVLDFHPEESVLHTSHESTLLQLLIHDDAFCLLGDFHFKFHPDLVFIPLEGIDPDSMDNSLVAAWHSHNENPCIPRLISLMKGYTKMAYNGEKS